MNINNVSKIIEGFSDFSNVDSMEEVRRKFEYNFKRISSFYNFDFAGLVIYDDFFGYFKPYINISQKQNEVLFNANSVFSTKSVADLAEVIDRDGSFFFSSRNQASAKISSYLDDININSGLFSLIKFNEKIVGITYFLNRNKDLKLDSYLRESLVVFARMISDSICILNYKRNAKVIADTMTKLGIRFFGGINSPYIWFECPNGMESWECFDYLLKNIQVVGTPGAGFGENGKNYFRLTSFGNYEKTVEAMERFEKLFG